MAAKFKVGKTYHVFHQGGMWNGHVKVLSLNEYGAPRVILTKLIKGTEKVNKYFKHFGADGCFLGGTDWNQKEINMTLENK